MEDLNASSYNITNFFCNWGVGADLMCGTDNADDIVKTQQLLDEIASIYGLTPTDKFAN